MFSFFPCSLDWAVPVLPATTVPLIRPLRSGAAALVDDLPEAFADDFDVRLLDQLAEVAADFGLIRHGHVAVVVKGGCAVAIEDSLHEAGGVTDAAIGDSGIGHGQLKR